MKYIILILSLILSNIFEKVRGANGETEFLKFLEEGNRSAVDDNYDYDRNSQIFLGHNFVTLDGTRGYNSLENRFPVSACFVPKSQNAHSKEAHLQFNSIIDKNEFFHNLEVRFGFRIGVPIPFTTISVGLAFDFGIQETTQKESNTASYYYVAEYFRRRDFDYNTLNPQKLLTPTAYKKFLESKKNNDDKFTELCGDSLVEKVTEGGMIVIEVNVQFISFEHMKRFEFEFSLQISQASTFSAGLGVSIKNAMKKASISGRTTIRGWQIGGNPEKLSNILYKEQRSQCSELIANDGDERKIDEECSKELNNIANYIKNDFPTQFGDDPQNYFLFDYKLRDNPFLKRPSNTTVDYEKIDDMKKQLVQFFDRNEYYLNRLENQIEKPISAKIIKNESLTRFVKVLQSNRNIIHQINVLNNFRFQDCFENLAQCNEENFNKAFALLDSKIFAEIDNYMIKIKYAYEFNIDLKNCCENCKDIHNMIIRSYPLGDGSYDIAIVGGNYFTNPTFAGFELIKGRYTIYSYNSFTLKLKDAFVTIIDCKNSPKRFIGCKENEFVRTCVDPNLYTRTWREVQNPFYVAPK